MRRFPSFSLLLSVTACLNAQSVHRLTLKEAIEIALRANPDVLQSRLSEQKAAQQTIIQKDPFSPKLYAGSGAAWTTGYPQSIDGNAPSVLQARAAMAVFNKPTSYRIAQAKENQHGAELETESLQDEVAYEVALKYIEIAQLTRTLELRQKQTATLNSSQQLIHERVVQGRQLPIDEMKAKLDLAVEKDRALETKLNLDAAEQALAQLTGFPAGDRVQASELDLNRGLIAIAPASEEQTVAAALQADKSLPILQSRITAKRLEIRSYKAELLPQVDLVAQYSLLAHYNYADSFARFQPNNGELGLSFKVPLLTGRAGRAWAASAALDVAQLELQVRNKKSAIERSVHSAYRDLERATSGRDVAKAAIEWAQENVRVTLERYESGRSTYSELEAARQVESEKWSSYLTEDHLFHRARLAILKQAGLLTANLR